jgi:hypothetical protein
MMFQVVVGDGRARRVGWRKEGKRRRGESTAMGFWVGRATPPPPN